MSKVEKALEKLAGIGYGGPHYGDRPIYDSPYDPDAWDDEGELIGKPVNIQAGLPSGTRRFLAARGIPMEEKARKYKPAIKAISEQEKIDQAETPVNP